MASHVSVPLLIKVADDHCVLNLSPGVPFIVTPPAGVIVVCPAPVCTNNMLVPTGNATEEFKGTVRVFALALLISTILSLSESARV